ncbi:hypothetical protein OWR29_02060 [Actinoplanes sp. Pm04-4]|uniref:Uncharacterized protein n=1 Tax=Paractinoplanes pyxinae TaxID=2997416 RepID=A0ABT4ASS1_9ACTN|nr:helix-turn-helix domain-containing protein [Actinoplanes pyxinae]MCY1136765.1 hypothetical protein [Actinoplanes pyxinae]
MARPERPFDPAAHAVVVRFAEALRALRREAGGPTYRQLAPRALCSKASLSEAASGRRLPTWEVTSGFVQACNGNVDAWLQRWQDARIELGLSPDPKARTPGSSPSRREARTGDEPIRAPQFAPGPPPSTAGKPIHDLRLAPGTSPSTAGKPIRDPRLAPGSSPSTAGEPIRRPRLVPGMPVEDPTRAGSRRSCGPVDKEARPGTESARTPRFVGRCEPVADNADPKRSGCADDPAGIVTLDRVEVHTARQELLGVAELRHAPTHRAAWGRFLPSDRMLYLRLEATVTIVAARPSTHTVGTPFTATFDGQAVYGDILLVGPGPVEITVTVHSSAGGGSATTACLGG